MSKSLRYFIGSCTASPVTGPLIQLIQANSEKHLILGTAHPSDTVPQKAPCHLVDPKNLNTFKKLLADSDVVIYDLATCDHQELEFAIQQLKQTKDEKFLICISSVMAWSETPQKEKQENDDGDLVDEDSEPEGDNEDKEERPSYVRYQETDYAERQAKPEYEHLISRETLCLSASVSQPNLKSYVLCSGILYGDQQFTLYEHFRQAWLQKYVQSGSSNRVPMIHVRDLAQFVFKITERPPKNKYIFAIDHNKENK